jgi:hypothetical protein
VSTPCAATGSGAGVAARNGRHGPRRRPCGSPPRSRAQSRRSSHAPRPRGRADPATVAEAAPVTPGTVAAAADQLAPTDARSEFGERGGIASPRSGEVHEHALDLGVRVDGMVAHLAAQPGCLEPAPGGGCVGYRQAVDEHRARADAGGQAVRGPQVLRPDRGREAVVGVVRAVDECGQLVLVGVGQNRQHRSEHLLAGDPHLVGHPGEHRRRVEPALVPRPRTAGDHLAFSVLEALPRGAPTSRRAGGSAGSRHRLAGPAGAPLPRRPPARAAASARRRDRWAPLLVLHQGASAKPHPQGRQIDHALVGQGGLVVAGGDRAVLRERLKQRSTTLRRLTATGANLGGRPPAEPRRVRLACWSRRSGMVARMRRRR